MEILKDTIKKVSFGVVNDSDVDTMVLNALINEKALFWCNGTLLSTEAFGMMDWTAKEAAAGNVYFLSLTKAPMEKYQHKLIHQDSKAEVPVVNLDNNKFWLEVLGSV